MPKLVIFRGDAVENELRLAGRPVRIGRDSRNDIVLDDKSVSRFHAEVRAEGNAYFIVDLKSRNGVWMNGQQTKGKAALAFGSPVTLGAFELALEDDVSTGEFDELAPVLDPPRVAKGPRADQPDRPSASGTRASMRAPLTARRQVIVWSGAAAAVLLICGVVFALIRYSGRPATPVEAVNQPPPPSPPEVRVVQPAPPPPEDPTRATIEQHLSDARAAQTSGDYAALREHATRVLELDPDNQEAREFKRLADAGARGAKPPQVVVAPPPPAPPTVTEVETPGIPRKPGEAWTDYTTRVQNIKQNLEAGKNYIAKGEFALGIARFRAVTAAQKGYQGVEGLITDAETKQRAAFDQAMKYGQDNEKLSPPRWSDALKWYLNAQAIDPNATTPRDRIGPLTERLTKEGTDAFDRAEVLRKRSENAKAIEGYRKAVDLLPSSHEKSREAQKWLETLKP